jgi:predicted nucleotidyltransferase
LARIVEKFGLERIILLGSAARGDSGPDSDVDLLVVMPARGSKWEKQLEIRKALGDIRVPVDILVSTPEGFGRRQEIVGHDRVPSGKGGAGSCMRDPEKVAALASVAREEIGRSQR